MNVQNFTRNARGKSRHERGQQFADLLGKVITTTSVTTTSGTTPVGYRGVLANDPLLMLPTNPDELANLLHTLSYDWAVDLDFIDRVARARGIEVDTVLVSQKVRDMNGEV